MDILPTANGHLFDMPEHDLVLTKANAPEVSAEEMEQLSKDMGLVSLPGDMVGKLVRLGVGLQERGLIKLANGAAMVTTQTMLDTIQRLHAKFKHRNRTTEEMRSLSYAIGYLSRQVTANLNTIVKQETVVHEVEQEQDKRRRKSFVPHAVVQASGPVQVNVHNYPQETEKGIAKGLKPA